MTQHGVVFLFDVDNTLLDNDRVVIDLRRYLEREVGPERNERYWKIFEDLRAELAGADLVILLQDHAAYDLDEISRSAHLVLDTRGRIVSPQVSVL